MAKISDIYRKRILIVCIIISLSFIWIHSIVPREQSYEESSFVLQVLKPMIDKICGLSISDHAVRKTAHFVEYSILGSLLTILTICNRTRWKVVFVFGAGVLTACLDEMIQIFSGRNSQVSDVMLDVSGVMAAYMVISIVYWLQNYLLEHHKK